MENNTENTNLGIKKGTPSLHNMFAHSYMLYFFILIITIVLDFIFPIRIFNNPIFQIIGLLLIVLSNYVIFWAQRASRKLNKENLSKESFAKGPYRFAKHPTYTSLFILMIGFSFVVNGAITFVGALLFYLLAKFYFIKNEERILTLKYGEHYIDYQKETFF
jgi:protein-S-isoprenylcysteine O-methyltransferase Ste14